MTTPVSTPAVPTAMSGANRRPTTARSRRRLPPRAAFLLQASIIVTFLAGSSAPTPLYAVYQGEWGFTPITVTVVFGVYALAVLVALLLAGSLSDYLGRRPVLLAAIAAQIVAMTLFAVAPGVGVLLVARVVQGLSTGAAVGALGAGMLDLDRRRGTVANAVAPAIGASSGALGSGLLVQYLPFPTHLVYLALLGAFVLQAALVTLMAETVTPKPGALASLRPRAAVPAAVRRPVLVAAPILVATWALVGFYASLGPNLARLIAHSHSLVLGGVTLFALTASAAVTVAALRDTPAEREMLYGAAALVAGVGLTVVAVSAMSTPLFFLGTVIAGSGFGAGFQGAIRTVVPLPAPHERAGVLSVLYVISYLAMGLPAIGAGMLVVADGSVTTTARYYSVTLIVLAALAGTALLREGTFGERGAGKVAAQGGGKVAARDGSNIICGRGERFAGRGPGHG